MPISPRFSWPKVEKDTTPRPALDIASGGILNALIFSVFTVGSCVAIHRAGLTPITGVLAS
jgi:hypothetical protein